MYAIRKQDLKEFTPDAYSVCRVSEGSTNLYLADERAIEEFLKGIEPKYNKAVLEFTRKEFSKESIYTLAGFAAYVITCSPAGMRLGSQIFRSAVEETGRRLDAMGEIPPPPPALGGTSFSELLQNNELKIEIDPKFPQAFGIAAILRLTIGFGNFPWDILVNDFTDSPFFTSDFPAAIEASPDVRIINRILPLSPNVAVRIRPKLGQDADRLDFTFSHFRGQVHHPSRHEIARINTLLVRSAETTVFYRDQYDWIRSFIRKNAAYRIEPKTLRIKDNSRTLLWTTQQICKR